MSLVIHVVIMLAVLSSQINPTVADEHAFFACYADVCNVGASDQFCSVQERRCRDCRDIIDDCFTPRLPLNCSSTCIKYNTDLAIQKAKETGCGNVIDIINGSHNSSIRNVHVPGDVIGIACDPGYRLSGSATMACMDFGQWANDLPTCEEIRCPRLPVVDNGSHIGSLSSSHPPGTVVVTVCRSGYQSLGPNSTKCNPDGSWSRQLPLCLYIKCSNPPLIRNGMWYPVGIAETLYGIGDEIHAACDDGFELDDTNAWTCSDKAEWISPAAQLFIPACFVKGEHSWLNGWMITTIILGAMLAILVCCVITVCKYRNHLLRKYIYKLVENRDVEKIWKYRSETGSSSRETLSQPDYDQLREILPLLLEKCNRNEFLQTEANNQGECRHCIPNRTDIHQPHIPNPTAVHDAIPKKAESLQQFADTRRRESDDSHADTRRRESDDRHADTRRRESDDSHADTRHRESDDSHADTRPLNIIINSNANFINENLNTNILSGINNTHPPTGRPSAEPNSSSATRHASPSTTPTVIGEASNAYPVEESSRFHPAQPESGRNSVGEDIATQVNTQLKDISQSLRDTVNSNACNNDINGTGLVVQQSANNEQDIGRKVAMISGIINIDDLNGHF